MKERILELKALTKVSIAKDIEDRIGSLSHPSKMPGPAWGISASHCITGSKLAKIPGTPCSICYAQKGHYRFTNVHEAQEKRLKGWQEDPQWSELMALRLLMMRDFVWFRWFDSGDLQTRGMLEDINKVAKLTQGKAKHWLATQERQFVKHFVPQDNLIIRVSSTKLEAKLNGFQYSSSASSDLSKVTCLSYTTDNACKECRKCWNDSEVVYKTH